MSKYTYTTDNGNTYDAIAVEFLLNGVTVGWVDIDTVLMWERGELTDSEVVSIARKTPNPPPYQSRHRFDSVTIG